MAFTKSCLSVVGLSLGEMPSATALLDAQVRHLATVAANGPGSQTPDNSMQTPGTENNQSTAAETADAQPTSLASLLDWVLQSPAEQVKPTNATTSSLVTVGEGLPLIPRKMLEKIQAGDYIDFQTCLLPKAKLDLSPRTGRDTY